MVRSDRRTASVVFNPSTEVVTKETCRAPHHVRFTHPHGGPCALPDLTRGLAYRRKASTLCELGIRTGNFTTSHSYLTLGEPKSEQKDGRQSVTSCGPFCEPAGSMKIMASE